MKGTKAQEKKYWLGHVNFWDRYYRFQLDPDMRKDTDEIARMMGEIYRKTAGNL